MNIKQTIFILFVNLSIGHSFASPSPDNVKAKSIIVTLKDGVAVDDHLKQLFETSSLDILRDKFQIKIISFDDYSIYSAQFNERLIKLLESLLGDTVEFVEPNTKASIKQSECPELEKSSWALNRITQREEFKQPRDDLPFKNDFGKNISIYIVDTGIDKTHQEFTYSDSCNSRVVLAYSAVGESAEDDNGHGTFVASIAGGLNVGVAKSASLVSVKVLDSQGEGSLFDIIEGLNWVMKDIQSQELQNGKSVVNLSFGAPRSRSLNRVVENLSKIGVPVVAAAGNEDVNACLTSPASTDEAITVAATNQDDRLAKFTNYGSCVDILAPGESILGACLNSCSQQETQCESNCPDTLSSYKMDSGTSFSAPLVAGTIAVLQSQNDENLQKEQGKKYVEAVTKRLTDSSTENQISGVGWFSRTPNRLLYIE